MIGPMDSIPKKAMPTCGYCGKANTQDAIFCNACGRRLEVHEASNGAANQASGKAWILASWRKAPKLKYIVLAGVIWVLFFVTKDFMFAKLQELREHAPAVAAELQAKLETFDVVNVARVALEEGRSHLWPCRENCYRELCAQGELPCDWRCNPSMGGFGYISCIADCEKEKEQRKLQCPDGFRKSCLPCVQHFEPTGIPTLPFVASFKTVKRLWGGLHWTGLFVAIVSILLGAALVVFLLAKWSVFDKVGDEGGLFWTLWLVIVLAAPAGFVIAFALKWLLRSLLEIFPHLLAVSIFLGIVAHALYESFKLARWLQSVVEGGAARATIASSKSTNGGKPQG